MMAQEAIMGKKNRQKEAKFQTAYFQQSEHICKESRTMSLPQ